MPNMGIWEPAADAEHTGALIKEAVEDLEWGALSSSVSLDMRNSPAEIHLAGSDTGDISIKLPVSSRVSRASVHVIK